MWIMIQVEKTLLYPQDGRSNQALLRKTLLWCTQSKVQAISTLLEHSMQFIVLPGNYPKLVSLLSTMQYNAQNTALLPWLSSQKQTEIIYYTIKPTTTGWYSYWSEWEVNYHLPKMEKRVSLERD